MWKAAVTFRDTAELDRAVRDCVNIGITSTIVWKGYRLRKPPPSATTANTSDISLQPVPTARPVSAVLTITH